MAVSTVSEDQTPMSLGLDDFRYKEQPWRLTLMSLRLVTCSRIGPDIYRVEDKVSPGAREALCLYFSNHADAIAFGRQILPVFKIKSREEHLGEPLGIFEVTGYCGCEKCCGLKGGLTKAEKIPKAGHTIAADPEVLPMGSKVEIDDIIYVVEDTGKLVKGNVIDIYFNTHEEAVRFGRQKINVYLVP